MNIINNSQTTEMPFISNFKLINTHVALIKIVVKIRRGQKKSVNLNKWHVCQETCHKIGR